MPLSDRFPNIARCAVILRNVLAAAIVGCGLAPRAAIAQNMAPISGNHSATIAQGWQAAADSKQMQLYAVLALRNTAELDQLEADLQNRHSPNYHKWLTTDQFVARFGPTAQQMTTVASWLTSQGFTVTSTNQRTRRVGFTGTVATVRQAFGTSILTDGSGSYVNTSDPMVPAQIAPTIQAIIGLTKMPTPSSSESQGRKTARARKGTSLFNDAIVNGQGPNFAPSDLYLFYDETSVLNAGNKGTGAPDCVGLPEQGDVTDSALADFTGQFNLPPVTLKKFLVNGSNPGLPSDNEPALDVEWVHAVSPNTPIYFYLADSSATSTPYLDAITKAVDDNVCGAISSSTEDTCPDVPTINVYNSVLQQAVAQGQTIFHSSGDYGANWTCGNVIPIPPIFDQSQCGLSASATGSQPSVDEEAASPFLTSVGGTQFNPVYNSAGNDVSVITDNLEVAWNKGESKAHNCPAKDASGGGKSVVFPKPAWQTGLNVPEDGARDIPDISMGADGSAPGFFVYSQTSGSSSPSLVATGGTSISSPMWAGISRLIAQSQGVTRLGNINPRLYELGNLQSASSGLHDITEGNNDDNGIPGFSAGPGYDLVTGWGSPDIALLVAAFPGAALTAQQAVNVKVAPGASAQAGTFSIANTTADPLQLASITVDLTASGPLSSLQAAATAAGVTQTATATPSSQTLLTFPSPLVIPSGQSAQVTLTVSAAGGSSSAIGSLFDSRRNGGGGFGAGGVVAMLAAAALVAMAGWRRRPAYAIAMMALCLTLGVVASSCGGSSGGGGSPGTASTLSLSQGSVNVQDGEGGIIEVTGLPVTLSKVTVK